MAGQREDIREVMVGRWRSVLPAFGIDARRLSGKHGPCPMCGGTDRWRWDNRDGRGTWICSQCGAGDGFDLVARLKGLDVREDFAAVAKLVRRQLGDSPPPADNDARHELSDDKRRELLRALWRASRKIEAGDEVDRYLTARWLGRDAGDYPAALRCCRRCEVSGLSGVQALPAMVALVTAPDGSPATLHRTYLGDGAKAAIPSPKRVMPGRIPPGSAVRLADPRDGFVAIAEGIETALAATAMWRVPAWAALSTVQLEAWRPPEGVKRVAVLADNDGNFAGHKAAYALAHRLAMLPDGIEVDVWVPPTDGADWADEWARTCEEDERRVRQ